MCLAALRELFLRQVVGPRVVSRRGMDNGVDVTNECSFILQH